MIGLCFFVLMLLQGGLKPFINYQTPLLGWAAKRLLRIMAIKSDFRLKMQPLHAHSRAIQRHQPIVIIALLSRRGFP